MEQHIGPFRTVAVLGQGGMGRVVLGVGPDGRYVAVKQVHAELAGDEGFRARFRREVDASRRVAGGYTAAVIDADPDAETPWLASQFVPGPSLNQALETAGPLPEEAVRRLAAGLAHALADVHRAGLIHRDLKPSNVLLAEDGVRVIDFGIVRAVGDQTRITHDGSLMGSPAFMSPEQVLGQELTPASDVFSLGATLVMACTGKPPFAGSSVPRILHEVVHAEPDLSEVPPRLREVIAWCLAKDPADRPTPRELLSRVGGLTPSARPWPEAVNTLIHDQLVVMGALLRQAAGPGTAPETTPEAVPLWRRRWPRPLIVAVAAAGVVAVAGLTVGRPYLVDTYREFISDVRSTGLAQKQDKYPAMPPSCEQVRDKVRVPSGFDQPAGFGPVEQSGSAYARCTWTNRTGDEIEAEWTFFATGKGEGTGAERAKHRLEIFNKPGETRRDIDLGFADEGLWQPPPKDDRFPNCRLYVRDVNMMLHVSVTGPRYPTGTCAAVTRELAASVVDSVGSR
ncbi:serine/threonine-protein kinase [Streptomyces sp. NBC_01443]|uniref:serine/threonine-protein kinase n=1 Tax=Streptomyces sp. NBC_01443 TaxID=2903868 RepID=UPI0022595646|nr:serine/threonine-protein kinase [Streptomyces sp. NBC_01443]MCX4630121.1 serine/threonine protein kinase [Streptomyces sp. NBC_01443]